VAGADDSTFGGKSAFRAIVCAVDGSAAGMEAARQAAILAQPDADLLLVAVVDDDGGEAERALEDAAELPAQRSVAATTRLIRGGNVARGLLDASSGADLLVVGGRADSGPGGVLLGSTASAAVHTAPLPVLVARPVPGARGFPAAILVATDGSPDSERAIELAGRIAAAHRSTVTLLHVNDGQSQPQSVLERGNALVREQAGIEATTTEEFGSPAQRLAEAARRDRSSLLMLGSRGLGRGPTLGSVSERLAHGAPCSVLVVRESVHP
jgi:nucleotide-binding universal stress UspA family protein